MFVLSLLLLLIDLLVSSCWQPCTIVVQHEQHRFGGQKSAKRRQSMALLALPSQEQQTKSSCKDSHDYHLVIEYATSNNNIKDIHQQLYAFWMAQEVLTTFATEPKLTAVTLNPTATKALQMYVHNLDSLEKNVKVTTLLRHESTAVDDDDDDTFMEPKFIKQQLRDIINPQISLGHSDTQARQEQKETSTSTLVINEPFVLPKEGPAVVDAVEHLDSLVEQIYNTHKSSIDIDIDETRFRSNGDRHLVILYCMGCRWMLRAVYYAQFLQSLVAKLASSKDSNSKQRDQSMLITLVPSRPPIAGGSLVVSLYNYNNNNNDNNNNNGKNEHQGIKSNNGNENTVHDSVDTSNDITNSSSSIEAKMKSYTKTVLWDRRQTKRFPTLKELENVFMASIPQNAHNGDVHDASIINDEESMDDEEAQDARRFFGVL